MAEAHLILKPRHTLVGKGLLPLIIDFKSLETNVATENLARLKKDHALENYCLEELTVEFKKLTGEALKDVIVLAEKQLSLDNAQQLMHKAILMANLVGGPKGSALSVAEQGPSTSISGRTGQASTATETPAVSTVSVSSMSASNLNSSDLEGRLKKMENNLDNMKAHQNNEKVGEALKNVRAMAGRPKLTPASVLIAAMEVLVESALKANHPETDFYSKALQACKQFEMHDDICGLCLKLLGSSEDKKISATIADWQKSSCKRESKEDKKPDGNVYNPGVGVLGQQCYPYPCPPYPFSGPVGMPHFGGPTVQPSLFQGYPFNGQSFQPRGYRQRFTKKSVGRGVCYYCKEDGHHVNACPKLKKE